MNTTVLMPPQPQSHSLGSAIKETINDTIDDLINSLPDQEQLSAEDRRGIIARYAAVLEGNFIYWMTAAYLSTQSEEARPILLENLHEEVRDAHPAMLRRFAIAADAFPTKRDALAVHEALTDVRLFLGRLSGVQSVLTMAFFEGFIQKFMAYLADLASAQGSVEMEYTDVHGVCDIAHTEGLFRAVAIEMAVNPLEPEKDLFEGVYLLRTLIEMIVLNRADARLA
jgi:Iron-containing redox enzyme